MATRWKAITEGVLECGWLIALAAIPVYFNPQTMRVFDGDKVVLFRTIALSMAPFLALWLMEARVPAKGRPPFRFLHLPLVRPALFWATVLLLSAAFSIAPGLSFFGSYLRMQGSYTWLCYVLVFLAVLVIVRRSDQIDRILDVLLLSSTACCLYALLQRVGIDSVDWKNAVGSRIDGTLGNPIYLGALLIMVMPLTVLRVYGAARPLFSRSDDVRPAAGKGVSLLALITYCVLLVIQFVVFVLTDSRGPWIGLVAGAGLFLLILIVCSRRIWLARSVCGIIVLLTLALGAWMLAQRWSPAGDRAPVSGPSLERLSSRAGTIQVRLLIWHDAGQLFLSNPTRMILGYGSETIFYTMTRFYSPALADIEKRGSSADRCHNETFDALLTTGLSGLIAEIALLLAFMVLLAGGLGLLEGKSARAGLIIAGCVGALAGCFVPWLALGNPQLSGIGMPAGLLAGLSVYLLFRAAWRAPSALPSYHPHHWLMTGLLVGGVAHFIEIQVGVATISTRMCFWIFAGLAVAVVRQPSEENPDDRLHSGAQHTGKSGLKSKGTRASTHPAILTGALVGLVMILVVFGLYAPMAPVRVSAVPILVICLGVWLLGLIFVVEKTCLSARGSGQSSLLLKYTGASIGSTIIFLGLYLPWALWNPSEGKVTDKILIQTVTHLANGVLLLYGFVFLTMAMVAGLLLRGGKGAGQAAPGTSWKAVALMVSLAICGVISLRTNLDFSRADVLAKQAAGYSQSGLGGAATVLLTEALRLQPGDPQYRRNLSNVLVLWARKTTDGNLARKILERARLTLIGLWEENSISYADAWLLSGTDRMLAAISVDASEKAALRTDADNHYRSAIELFPANSQLLNEYADSFLDQGDVVRALEWTEKSLKIDGSFPETYSLRARIRAHERAYDLALEDYEHALALSPHSETALNGRTLMQQKLRQSEDKSKSASPANSTGQRRN